MSISRARWSETEKLAVLDAYNTASDADEFFVLLKNALGASFFRRTVKAYLTFLNDNLLPKTDPRRPVYQSLCDANQKEIAAAKAAEEAASFAAATPVPVTVTPAPETSVPVAVAPDYNWVEKEIDVVPRVPPGRAAPPSLFRDPSLPTLTEALATQAAQRAAQLPWGNTPETARRFDGATRYDTGPETRPVVTPDPKALVPRHYPPLPPKAKLTADELAQVFGLHRTKVMDAFAYGFIQTLDGIHITYQTAQRIHDAMSEGHSFSEACRQVNPNSSGLLPMEALIEKVDPPAVEDQSPVVVPDTEAGKVSLKVDDWTVNGGPMNPKSLTKMASDLNTQGPSPTTVEVLNGPKSLFEGGEVFPLVKSVEVPAEPAKTVTPGGESVQYAETIRVKLNPTAATEDPVSSAAPEVPSGAFERYTLEAVRDGVLTTTQGVDILNPTDTKKAVWALSLLASGKITVVQCDRLLFAKTVPFPSSL